MATMATMATMAMKPGNAVDLRSNSMKTELRSCPGKIHPQDLGYASTKRAFQVSLDRLKTSYLDAMLLRGSFLVVLDPHIGCLHNDI